MVFSTPSEKKKVNSNWIIFFPRGTKKLKKKIGIFETKHRGVFTLSPLQPPFFGKETDIFTDGNTYHHRSAKAPTTCGGKGDFQRMVRLEGKGKSQAKKLNSDRMGRWVLFGFFFHFLCEEKYFGWWLSSKLCNNIACKLGWRVITCSTDFVLEDTSTIQVGLNILHETCRTEVEVVSSGIFLSAKGLLLARFGVWETCRAYLCRKECQEDPHLLSRVKIN